MHTEQYARAGQAGVAGRGLAFPTAEPGTEVAIDLADALSRCVASGIEQTLVRASLTLSQRARLQGVFDPIPTSIEISVYVEDQMRGGTLGFYVIALEHHDEISHAEHATLTAAVQAAEAEYGVPRTAWGPAT
ncbi:MAG: hypothetical protein JWN32_3621 [Solirubrobacterales bacterium]|nr:hypothetical protein [Solirubrobacterales bacterium]